MYLIFVLKSSYSFNNLDNPILRNDHFLIRKQVIFWSDCSTFLKQTFKNFQKKKNNLTYKTGPSTVRIQFQGNIMEIFGSKIYHIDYSRENWTSNSVGSAYNPTTKNWENWNLGSNPHFKSKLWSCLVEHNGLVFLLSTPNGIKFVNSE